MYDLIELSYKIIAFISALAIYPYGVCSGSRIKMLRICSSPEARICEAILGGFTLVHT